MTRAIFKWLAFGVTGLTLAVLAGGWLADRWLESAGGRRLLERELTRAVGPVVRLEGDYHFRLLPRIQVTGNGLRIGGGRDGPIVSMDSFRTVVGLLPLLRGILRIDSVLLGDGRVDVARLGELGGAAGGEGGGLPAVASLAIEDVVLALPGGVAAIDVQRLHVEGFRAGQPVPLDLAARLQSGGEAVAAGQLRGTIRVAGDLGTVVADVDRLTVTLTDRAAADWEGRLEWRAAEGALDTRIGHQSAEREIHVDLSVTFGEPLAGEVSATYAASGRPAATAAIGFERHPTAWELSRIRFDIGGQTVSGAGCVRTDPAVSVELSLEAPELDLDALQAWLPQDPSPGGAELPVDLAMAVEIGVATGAGAVAHGVRMVAGREPSCPGTGDPDS